MGGSETEAAHRARPSCSTGRRGPYGLVEYGTKADPDPSPLPFPPDPSTRTDPDSSDPFNPPTRGIPPAVAATSPVTRSCPNTRLLVVAARRNATGHVPAALVSSLPARGPCRAVPVLPYSPRGCPSGHPLPSLRRGVNVRPPPWTSTP